LNFFRFFGIFHKNHIRAMQRKGLKLGKNVYMDNDVYIDNQYCWLISIGDDCVISSNVKILAHDASPFPHIGHVKTDKVTIGCRTYIGASSIILPGVRIGDDVIIGAGSIVTHDVPDNSVAAGNPARVIATVSDFLKKHAENVPAQGLCMKIEALQNIENKRKVLEILNEGPCYISFDQSPDILDSSKK